jgi:hypothetical protein
VEITILGRRRNLLRVIPFIPLVFLVFSFWEEIFVYYRWFRWGLSPNPVVTSHAFQALFANIFIFTLMFMVWLWIVSSQSVYPATRLTEIAATSLYLILHFLGLHGMAAYVRNGKIKAYVDELQRTLPGVVVVDFNSAIAVERIALRPGLFRIFKGLFRGMAALLGFSPPPVRILGAGLHFTLPDERIHGVNDLESHPFTTDEIYWMERILNVVDLRTQFRISGRQPHKLSKRLKTSVFAYTRDGIEVKTNIWLLATLGEEPVPLHVTYDGDWDAANLRVVKIKTLSQRAGLYRVESFTDDLDPEDRIEIHEKWKSIVGWTSFKDIPEASVTKPSFNPDRVFSAIFARARHHRGLGGADEIIPWVDLPIHVAIDLFREIISRYNYDEISTPDANGKMKANEIRGELASAMRNSGILSFRPVYNRAGISLEKGMKYLASDLLTIPSDSAYALQTPKVLRDRGIRIIVCGFGDLVVDERIYKQRLDNWQATWDQETEIVQAGLDWESTRVHTQARIQAQQDFVQYLSQIYQSNGTTKEILALRVLQALEEAAADPKTRQLLPDDTFSMLRSIHDWLLPQDMGYGSES